MTKRILIIEDEEKIARILVDYLARDGFETEVIIEGTHAVEQILQQKPDLVLLDLMLPGKDGITICREVRDASSVPIIMTTARVDDIDRILGLEIGADDYICKPYNPHEVVARVKSVLRRVQHDLPADSTKITYHDLVVDQTSFKAYFHENLLDLTAVEFRLLYVLAASPGRVYSREQLMQNAYTDDRIVEGRTIDTHIKNIRRKLSGVNDESELIQSVYGVGYRLE